VKTASHKPGWKIKDFGKLQPESPLSRDKTPAAAMKKRHVLLVSFIKTN
jgi:hypothetical protein